MQQSALRTHSTAILALLLATGGLSARAAVPQRSVPGDPLVLLHHLNRLYQRAGTINFYFNAVVTTVGHHGSSEFNVNGTLSGAARARLNVYAPSRNGSREPATEVSRISSDGTTFTAYDVASNAFVKVPASADSLEPDQPDSLYFLVAALKGGDSVLAVSGLLQPADFAISDTPAAPDAIRRLVTTAVPTLVDGTQCVDVVQTLTGSRGTHAYHTVVNKRDGTLKQYEVDKLLGGRSALVQRIRFVSLTVGPASKTSPAAFTISVPPDAHAFVAPHGPGSVAEDFTYITDNGQSGKLSGLRGKVVVIDFWATWCGPCRKTLPQTNKLAGDYAAKDVVFLPVCTWDTPEKFSRWVTAHKSWNLRFVRDPASEDQDTSIARSQYAVVGIPTMTIISRDGTVLYRAFPGVHRTDAEIRSVLDKALDAQSATTALGHA